MMKMSNMLLVVGVLMISGVAQAVMVIHNDNTVFEDYGFEADTVDSAPTNAVIGTWRDPSTSGSTVIAVVNASDPGPHDRDNYLKVYDRGTCNIHAALSDQTITTGTIVIKFMACIPSFATVPLFILGQDTTGHSLNNAIFWVSVSTAGDVQSYDGSDQNDTGLDAKLDTWQEWTFTVDMDADTFTVDVDGTTSSSIAVKETGLIARDFILRGGVDFKPAFYVDAVPDPEPFDQVEAILIRHNSSTVFEDDGFEADTVDTAPTNAVTGTWRTPSTSGGSSIVVKNAAPPGAFHGGNYLRVFDNGTCNIHAALSKRSITNGTIRIKFRARVSSFTTLPIFILGQDTAGHSLDNSIFWVSVSATGDVQFYDGSNQNDTGLDAKLDTWQEWTFTVDMTANTFTVDMDGTTSSSIAVKETGLIARDFIIRGGADNKAAFYVDATRPPAGTLIVIQ